MFEKPTTEEMVAQSRLVILTKWAAYKAIQSGGKFCVGDKKLYNSVRKRLKGAFLGDEEKLKRFILLK